MGKLSDAEIRAWIRKGEHFHGRSDGSGLTLKYPKTFKDPAWVFRYSIAGEPSAMSLGSYRDIGLKAARDRVKQLRAQIALGNMRLSPSV